MTVKHVRCNLWATPEGTSDPIHVEYSDSESAGADSLLDYPIFVPGWAESVPLRAVAHIDRQRGQGVVTREDLAPTLEVSAFTEGRPLNFIISDVEESLRDIVIPRGYEITLTGEKSDLAEAKTELGNAFGIALIAVYLLLVAQLRSFLHPLTIMVSIPLSLVGVFAALWIAGKPASMPVMVGMILLAGTVVNNAILLIDFIRQKREQGSSRHEALVSSVTTRFRPIMMTSLSTIVGMIPLAAEWALGSERFSPLATAVIGGMTAATMLTMIFIPVLYDLFDDITKKVGGLFGRTSAIATAFIVTLLLSGNAVAAESITLDLNQSVQMATEQSHGLKQSKDETRAADFRHKQAVGRFLPKVVFSAGYSRVQHVEPGTMDLQIPGMDLDPPQLGEAVDNRYFLKLSVEQPLFTGFALSSALQTTTYVQELTRERERLEEAAVTIQVQETYFTLLKAEQLKELSENSLDNLIKHQQRVQKLYEAGRATGLDVSRIESRISAARVNMVQATGAVDSSTIALSTLIGVPLTTEIQIVDILDSQDNNTLMPTEDLLAQAYAKRPEIGVAKSAVSIAKERVDIEGSGLWPQVGARFGYIYSRPNQLYFPLQDETNGSWDVSVFLSWTLWDWGTTYNGMRAAKAEASAANHAVEEIKDAVRMDVERRVQEYQTAAQKIAAARSGIESAKRAFKTATELFDAGRLTSLDLLNAEFELTQANFQLVQTLADARIAWARVQKATGETNPI